jgi:hypothetical protein
MGEGAAHAPGIRPVSRASHRTKLPARRAAQTASSREFLGRLARILVGSGHSPKALSREFRDICAHLAEPRHRFDPEHLGFVADLPHVLARWHADPRFVDSGGAPLPLPRRARGASLEGLIRAVLPQAEPSKVVRALLDLRAVARQGARYVPTGRYLAYNAQHASALAHGLTALLGMLSTLEQNLFGGTSGALLERAAMNPRFPVEYLDQFHKRLRRRAGDFLFSMDRDMRRYEARPAHTRTTRLGVCVFAFEEPRITGALRVKRRILQRKRR